MMRNFMRELKEDLRRRPLNRAAIPEQFYLLRSLQFAAHHWR